MLQNPKGERELTEEEMDNVQSGTLTVLVAIGTVVALYCPTFVKGVNTPGWHFHFISDKRDKGGHVLALGIKNATISYDVTRNYSIILPDDNNFGKLDLGVDQSKDIHKVEQAEKKNL